MQTIILLLLAILSSRSNAAEIPQPFEICSGFECPTTMKEISLEFSLASAVNQSLIPFVASGECYHRTPQMNPEIQHHGVILLDTKDNSTFSGGSYSFFYKENPYAGWTPQMVREKNPGMYGENHKVVFKDTFAFVDMNPNGPAESRVNYWYRQSATHFYVLGAWGYDHAFICRFQPHNNQ